MERKPTFDLARVAAAARERRINLGKKRAREILLQYLDGLVTCVDFACAVVLALKSTDFNVTKDLKGGLYDEYGIQLSEDILEKFSLDVEAWYVKLTIREGSWGEEVFCLSLHPLEEEMNCVGGRLVPTNRNES